MNRKYGDSSYASSFVEDRKKGMAGLELYRTRGSQRERVARILFWDASGQFAVETFNFEVPLDVLEEVIAEAKGIVKTA